jgi:hypothetical protein
VLELAQVAEIVIKGQILFTHPSQGFIQPALYDPNPRLQRRDGAQDGEDGP